MDNVPVMHEADNSLWLPQYVHPQETWDDKKCAKVAKYNPKNAFGDRGIPGQIASHSSSYPQYGQQIRYNGGTIIDGELYKSVRRPFPIIPAGWKIVSYVSWGFYLVRA